MAKTFEINDHEWTALTPASGENADLVLSATASRLVTYTEGPREIPILLKQIAMDPAHPFTAGQMIVTLETAIIVGAHVRDVAHSPDFDHGLFEDENQNAPGVTHQGGLYLTDYRRPLEWLIQVYTQVTPAPTRYYLQINAARPDAVEIDADDQTAAAITIDDDTEETTPAAFALSNGTSTPSEEGGVEMRWQLTAAQYGLLTPSDTETPPARVHKKIGLTIAAASSVAPVTYSAHDETHPERRNAEKFLRLEESVGLKAPSSGAWYARLARANLDGSTAGAVLHVGD